MVTPEERAFWQEELLAGVTRGEVVTLLHQATQKDQLERMRFKKAYLDIEIRLLTLFGKLGDEKYLASAKKLGAMYTRWKKGI